MKLPKLFSRKDRDQKPGTTETKIPREIVVMAWVLVLGAIAPMLDSTMVNIAINQLGHDFATTLSTVQWVMTGYILATGVAVPLSGWLTKRFDGKQVFIFAEAGFLLTSLMCGLSWNIESLIIFRLFQGMTAGILIPMLMNLLLAKAGHENLGRLMATVSLPVVLGPILGPVLGGFIVQYLDWRWMFFVNIFVALLAVIVCAKVLPKFPATEPKAHLDFVGLGLLASLSTAFIYGIVQAGEQATFANSQTILWCSVGVVCLIIYMIYAKIRREKALVPLDLFRHRNFSAVNVGLFLAGIATNGPMLLLPLLFQNVRGLTVVGAALMLLPQGIGMLIARPIIGKLIDKIGAKWVVMASLAITVIGTLPLVWVGVNTSNWWIWLVLFVRGIGVGGITIPLMTDAYTGIAKEEVPAATTDTRIVQNIGGAFGSAVLATVVAASLSGFAKPSVAHFATAYQDGFLVATILALIIFIPGLFLTDKSKIAKEP